MADKTRVVVVGGGAAGFFAAIACAEKLGAAGEVTWDEGQQARIAERADPGADCP